MSERHTPAEPRKARDGLFLTSPLAADRACGQKLSQVGDFLMAEEAISVDKKEVSA